VQRAAWAAVKAKSPPLRNFESGSIFLAPQKGWSMPDLPEFYADQFVMTVGAFGTAMTFGLSPAHPNPGQAAQAHEVARLRMSLEHAKVMAMILKRNLKAYEDQIGSPIGLPREVYRQLGLSQEDW
jgi:hypothetical protein